MKKHSSSRSGLFLMEIIIAILFFSVVSAICLQLFVKAHNLGQNTEELDAAVRQAGSAADILSRSKEPMEQLEEIYPDSDMDKTGGLIYFAKDFQNCGKEDAVYCLKIATGTEDDGLCTYNITFYANDEADDIIYSMDVTAYRQIGAS